MTNWKQERKVLLPMLLCSFTLTQKKKKLTESCVFRNHSINEIQWNSRLNPLNHHELFPLHFTGIIDTAPVFIKNPSYKDLQIALWNVKNNGKVEKIQVVIDFRELFIILGHISVNLEINRRISLNVSK